MKKKSIFLFHFSQLDNLRELLRNKVDDKAQRTIARNLRPIFPKGSRAIRTNIAHVYGLDEKCYQNRVEHTYRGKFKGVCDIYEDRVLPVAEK